MRRSLSALLSVLCLLPGCGRTRGGEQGSARGTGPVEGARLAPASVPADDGQWTMPARDYSAWRFGGLTEINAGNVAQLREAWTFSTGLTRGHEAAPLVVGDTMYLVTPYPNRLHAFDLTKPGAPPKWTYEPPVVPAAQGVACCDVVNRGAAFAHGAVYYNTLDDQTVAVDAATGKERWRTRVGDIDVGETMTMAPLVVRDRVIVGNSGGEFGVRGWIAGLDARTGAIVWRAYSTGPDRDVLIGPNFKPFYPMDQGTDLGVKTWPPDKWRIGGGTVWGWLSYDPEADLLYHGTGNPGPWNPDQRPGDNKWTCGIFARRPDTGEAIWYYQWSPHDLYDHDGVNEAVLVDLEVGGRLRKTLIHPGRTGYMYVLDRLTGEVLSAEPFVHITSSERVDLKTGRLVPVPGKEPGTQKTVRGVCPAAPGGKDWQPSAFSPRTGLLYVPHQNLCQDEEGFEANYIAGTPYLGAEVRMYAGPGGKAGAFMAWDPIAAKPVWRVEEEFPVFSGALVTAGDVVFYGTLDGVFKALHAKTGELLWQRQLESGIIGQPITWRGPDGKQYIAIFAGVGGWPGAVVAANLDPRDQSAALGFANATKELQKRTKAGGRLYVFSLP